MFSIEQDWLALKTPPIWSFWFFCTSNTIASLDSQRENLQAAESQVSDVDLATEMTEFTKNQVLTQSAVAMLAQANSLPQMALRLLG